MQDTFNSAAEQNLIGSAAPPTRAKLTAVDVSTIKSNQIKSSTSTWIFSEQSSQGAEGSSC